MNQRTAMTQTARIFTTGRSQAIRLPLEYRFESKEVFIR
jgi:antitoxin VapB